MKKAVGLIIGVGYDLQTVDKSLAGISASTKNTSYDYLLKRL